MRPAQQAEIHSILSQFYGLMHGMDTLLEQDSGVARDALSTMIDELQLRYQSSLERSIATDVDLKETPLPF